MKLPSLIALLALFPFQSACAGGSPILVELFTSQGCSSCPPAENWLNTRGMELFKQGKIIPLAFHVDYWNYLGWKDPFSSPAFSARQRDYAEKFGDSSVYTPQMVVAGRVGFVGSDGDRAMKALSDPANQKAQSIGLSRLGDKLKITLPRPLLPGEKLYLAILANQRVTQVERGENGGKTLEENFVVTRLEELHSTNATLPLPGENIGIVVFAQKNSTMEITAVGWAGMK
jgi:hypothetical protein